MAEQQISTCQEQRKKAFVSLEANKFILAKRFKEAKMKQDAKIEQLQFKRMEQHLKHQKAARRLQQQQLLLTAQETSSSNYQPRLKYEQQDLPRLSYKEEKQDEDDLNDFEDIDLDEGMNLLMIIYKYCTLTSLLQIK